jgi:hypothetical protein
MMRARAELVAYTQSSGQRSSSHGESECSIRICIYVYIIGCKSICICLVVRNFSSVSSGSSPCKSRGLMGIGREVVGWVSRDREGSWISVVLIRRIERDRMKRECVYIYSLIREKKKSQSRKSPARIKMSSSSAADSRGSLEVSWPIEANFLD